MPLAEDPNQHHGPYSVKSLKAGFYAWTQSYERLPELSWPRSADVWHIVLGVGAFILGPTVGAGFGEWLDSVEAFGPVESGGPTARVAMSLVGLQLATFLWPFLISKVRNGLGVAKDWGAKISLSDLSIGIAAGILALVLAPMTGSIVAALIGLEDTEGVKNTGFLTDAQGSPLLVIFVFAAVIGAPIAEEMFFRGVVQRSLERSVGRVAAVFGSTLLFTLPHFTGAELKPTIVLFSSIGVIGLMWGVIAAITNRLGPTIIGHIVFNSTVVTLTLAG